MIAKHRKPVEHEFGMRIDQLVVGSPQRVVDRSYTVEVVNVANGKHTLHTRCLSHVSHQLGYGLLIVVAVASKVVCHVERNVTFKSFPFLRGLCLQLQAAKQHEGRCQNGSCALTESFDKIHSVILL